MTDSHQRKGVGTELLRQLINVARQENIERLIAYTRPENTAMLALIRRFQFSIAENEDPRSITAVLDLRQTPAVQ